MNKIINRRSFLKIASLAGAALATGVMPQLRLEEVSATEPNAATVREIIYYDAGWHNLDNCNWHVRHDITNGKEQYSVDSVISGPDENPGRYRPPALSLLQDVMKQKGWQVSDLKPLVLPITLPKGVTIARNVEMPV